RGPGESSDPGDPTASNPDVSAIPGSSASIYDSRVDDHKIERFLPVGRPAGGRESADSPQQRRERLESDHSRSVAAGRAPQSTVPFRAGPASRSLQWQRRPASSRACRRSARTSLLTETEPKDSLLPKATTDAPRGSPEHGRARADYIVSADAAASA